MWFLGVETRNKCLYVVTDQLGALESLYEGIKKGFPEDGVFITVMRLCVLLLQLLQ